ncbi:DNA primase large subunit PriL [Geoglobus sp.]
MKLLPVLPVISDYPFLKPARFIAAEVKRGIVFDYALERAEEMLEPLLKNGVVELTPSDKTLYCSACDSRSCRVVCERGAMADEILWERCNLCGDCFNSCSYTISSDIYMESLVRARVAVYSYIMMRSAVSSSGEAVRRRFATSLARSYRMMMENDSSDLLPEIMASNFSIKVRRDDGLWVHVSDYLTASSRIRSPEWKLVARNLRKGYVELSSREFYRVVEERLRDLFFEPFTIPIEGIESLRELVSDYEMSRRVSKIDGVKDFELFPPCMKKIVADLKDSANVAHTARFAITTFMLSVGYSVDEILDLFRNAPDFDEEKARYQIEHIAGQRGAGKEYDVPSCSTMKTYHNCVANCGVRHPMEYYRRRVYEGRGRKAEGE